MQSRLFTFSIFTLLFLGLITGCSKSKKPDQGTNNTDGATLKNSNDPNKSIVSFAQGTPTCQKFFYLVHLANKMHLKKSTMDPMKRLAKRAQDFTDSILNKEYELDSARFKHEKIIE